MYRGSAHLCSALLLTAAFFSTSISQGQKKSVSVILTIDGTDYPCSVKSITDSTITVDMKGEVDITHYSHITRIHVDRPGTGILRVFGVIIGVPLGAGLGYIIGYSDDPSCDTGDCDPVLDKDTRGILGGLIGIAIGGYGGYSAMDSPTDFEVQGSYTAFQEPMKLIAKKLARKSN